jgi:predicted nucleic acid-binding protein
MIRYVVVDASVWVSRLVEEDVFHDLCRQWLNGQRSRGNQFLAPALLLVEVAAAISRRTGDTDLARRAVHAIKMLPDLRLVEMSNDVVETAVVMGAELGVRAAGAFYIAVAQQLGLPLATLDSDQRQRAMRVIEAWAIE